MKESCGGVGFFGLLTITFIVLRLCHVISWPWVWVLSPFWLPLAIMVLVFLLYVGIKWLDDNF